MNNHVVYKRHNASHIYSMLLIPMSRHRRCVRDRLQRAAALRYICTLAKVHKVMKFMRLTFSEITREAERGALHFSQPPRAD